MASISLQAPQRNWKQEQLAGRAAVTLHYCALRCNRDNPCVWRRSCLYIPPNVINSVLTSGGANLVVHRIVSHLTLGEVDCPNIGRKRSGAGNQCRAAIRGADRVWR